MEHSDSGDRNSHVVHNADDDYDEDDESYEDSDAAPSSLSPAQLAAPVDESVIDGGVPSPNELPRKRLREATSSSAAAPTSPGSASAGRLTQRIRRGDDERGEEKEEQEQEQEQQQEPDEELEDAEQEDEVDNGEQAVEEDDNGEQELEEDEYSDTDDDGVDEAADDGSVIHRDELLLMLSALRNETAPTLSRAVFMESATRGGLADHFRIYAYLQQGGNPQAPDVDAIADVARARMSLLFGLHPRLGSDSSVLHCVGNNILYEEQVLRTILDMSLPWPRYSTPLHAASTQGHVEIVAHLLKSRAIVNERDKLGWTPLMFAIRENHEYVVRMLLREKADVNAYNDRGWTPVSIATVNNYISLLKLMLESRGDPNIATVNGKTPLMIALEKGHVGVVPILLRHGADPNRVSAGGRTALIAACDFRQHNVLSMLLDAKADPSLSTRGGWTALMMTAQLGLVPSCRSLLHSRADPDTVNHYGKTALAIAARHGFHEIVELLASAGASLLSDGDPMHSPLCVALQMGHERTVQTMREIAVKRGQPEHTQLEKVYGATVALLTELKHSQSTGMCTYRVTRDSFMHQEWYVCRTCGGDDEHVGVCISCAQKCHASHELEAHTASMFFCDCGHGHFPTACACLRVSGPYVAAPSSSPSSDSPLETSNSMVTHMPQLRLHRPSVNDVPVEADDADADG